MNPTDCKPGVLVEYKGEILKIASMPDDRDVVICKGGKRFKRAGQYQVAALRIAGTPASEEDGDER